MRNWLKAFSPAIIVLGASVVWAVATTSIVQKSSGSAFTLDMALDSVTGANRQMTYLADPSTAGVVSPATSTKQPAFGVSGTPSNDVMTTQGQVGMVPLIVDASANSIQGSAAGVAPPAGNNVVATQGIAGMTPLLVTPSSVALPANQSVNVSQINAVTPLMGNGVTGTGSPRVTIASDNTPFTITANAGTNLNTSTLALDTSVNATSTPVTPATATATKGTLGGCQYNTTLPVFTNGQQGMVGCDQNGAINAGFDGFTSAQFDVTSATTVFTADMTGYESIDVQVVSAGVGSTVTYTASLNNVNFTQVSGAASSFAGGQDMITTTTAVGIWSFPKMGRYFRAAVTTYGSGTISMLYTLNKKPFTIPGGLVAAQGRGASATTANTPPFPIAVVGRTTNLAVTTGQQVYAVSNLAGAQIVYPWSIPELTWSYAVAAGGISNTTAVQTIKAASGSATVSNYIKNCTVASDALGAATDIIISDGSGGTVLWRTKLGTAMTAPETHPFEPPLRTTGNTAAVWSMATASITGAVFVSCQGYQGP